MNFAKNSVLRAVEARGLKLLKQDRLHYPPDLGAEFRPLHDAVRPFTMTSAERLYALHGAVDYVLRAQVPGDFVECGVWRGGSSMLIAQTLVQAEEAERLLWLYDTFAGMTEPTEEDEMTPGLSTDVRERWESEQTQDHNEWCYAALSDVQQNMASTGFPNSRIRYVEGMVEATIPETIPDQIAVLRLDTDWYASTAHELEHLYPKVALGGVVVIDDYGHWAGARRAVDEFLSRTPGIIMHRIDRTGRVFLKTQQT